MLILFPSWWCILYVSCKGSLVLLTPFHFMGLISLHSLNNNDCNIIILYYYKYSVLYILTLTSLWLDFNNYYSSSIPILYSKPKVSPSADNSDGAISHLLNYGYLLLVNYIPAWVCENFISPPLRFVISSLSK